MESSPLILAQSHARQAVAVSLIDPTAAVGEHDRAAGQYAAAAKDTSSSEAFRTLKLLQSYHERLAQLLKFDHTPPAQQASASDEKTDPQANPSKPPPKPQEESPYRSQQSHHPPPPRDISSSIASNLASARGIPTNRQRRGSPASPASSTQHAEGKLTTPARRPKPSDRPSRAAPNPIQEKVQSSLRKSTPTSPPSDFFTPTPIPTPPTTEKPFERFYSTFDALKSAFTAPLIFAGLPLNIALETPSPDPPPTAQPPNTTTKKTPKPAPPTSLSDNPDYTRAFSRAALRALNPTTGSPFAAHESFYVVPTTGHTTSYADILARTQREAAKALPIDHSQFLSDEPEFVDARETPQPPSPTTSRTRGGIVGGGKTMEELTLENGAMRDLMDVLSKRLAQFEMGSQSQSQALWQSFRQDRPPPPPLPGAGLEGVGDTERVAALEARLQSQKEDIEKMGQENEKLRGVVSRYRERWEKLKEGARSKRAGTDG